ncbi:MAG: ATP-binding protein [Lachnospiraceae bacterium]|nr:ATP-binding protein [Lachnospiraceae bacterium]
MRAKIFRSMSLITLFSIIVVALVSTMMDYRNFEKRMKGDVENITALIRRSVEKEGVDFLREMDNQSEYRITYISQEGDVLYDSQVDNDEWDEMNNHLDRPEVQQAIKEGVGRTDRWSHTLSEKTYYYAEKMGDGSILRVAMADKSQMTLLLELLPELILITLIMVIFAFLISRHQTKKIVEPINQINFDDSEESSLVYEELYPFIQKIRKQKELIEKQIKDIRSSKGEFETITENMSEGLIVIDKHENVLSYNKSAMELLELTANPERFHSFVAFCRNETIIRQVEMAMKGERTQNMIHIGQKVNQVTASPVVIDGKVNGVVVVVIDETEKELRDELRREFSANVSHELKTPLTSISGYAEIMESGMVKDEDMIKFSGIIHAEAMRLISLVEDIIKISRLDENQVDLEQEDVKLNELVTQNMHYLKGMADKKNVSMVQIGSECIIHGVRQILDEMVHNLMENAIKYNKDGGNVIVSVDSQLNQLSQEQMVVLTVKDSGIGIPASDLERVFERFYRVDKSHSKAIGGTGLGLSIVKHGAIYHDAKIQVESEVGKGTTISIIFHGVNKS